MRRLLSFLGILGITACDSGVTIYSNNYDAYSPSYFVYAAADRDFLVQVQGNPFGISDDALADSVVAAMQGHNRGPRTRFVTKATDSTRPDYRAVIVFEPAPTLRPQDVCQDRAQGRTPAAPGSTASRATIELLAVFCGPTGVFSSLQARAPVKAPDDATFKRLFTQVTLGLFPDTDQSVNRGESR